MKLTGGRITILYSDRHERHPIVRRQIGTFLRAGYSVDVVDQRADNHLEADRPYQHRIARLFRWSLATSAAWLIIRRIPWRWARDQFWTMNLWLRLLSNALSIAVAAVRTQPDCYVAEDLQSALAALVASWYRARPVIFCAHELESEQGSDDEIRRRVLRGLQRWLIPKVDRLVVPNAARAAVFERDYRPRTAPVVVLNCPPRSELNHNSQLHERLGLSTSEQIVLYHGALIPFRALDKLVQSAALFPPHAVLVLIGDQGDYYQKVLAPLVASDQLRGKVFTLPYVAPDKVAEYVASADLGVVIYENVNLNNFLCAPTKLYEFLSMQIPVVACNFPEVTRLLDEYKVGVSFDPAVVESIASAVHRFFAMSASERNVLRGDLARAREDFAWEHEEQKWLALLQSTIPVGMGSRSREAAATH